MKKIISTSVLFFALLLPVVAQQASVQKALTIYPLNNKLGYRSNLDKKGFWDFKGGATFSRLPLFVLDLSRNYRWLRTDRVKGYSGLGLSLESYVPGIFVPVGLEFIPFENIDQLTIIAEANPKMTFGPTNLFNVIIDGHLGVAYYLRKKAASVPQPVQP